MALAGLALLTSATVGWANEPLQFGALPVQSGSPPPPAASGPTNPPVAEQDFFRLRRPPGQPRETPQDHGQRDSAPDEDGPGCPANQRPLDLLV